MKLRQVLHEARPRHTLLHLCLTPQMLSDSSSFCLPVKNNGLRIPLPCYEHGCCAALGRQAGRQAGRQEGKREGMGASCYDLGHN